MRPEGGCSRRLACSVHVCPGAAASAAVALGGRGSNGCVWWPGDCTIACEPYHRYCYFGQRWIETLNIVWEGMGQAGGARGSQMAAGLFAQYVKCNLAQLVACSLTTW